MPEVDQIPQYELLIDEETYQKIWERVKAHPRLRPMHIGFDEPYDEIAFWLEHGTGPAQPGKKDSPRADGKTARDRIGDWVDVKYAKLSKEERAAKREEMYERIMQTGTPPHPFIRPAFEDMYNEGNARKILESGGSTEDIARETVNLMIDYLRQNDSITYSDGTTSIEQHIYYEPFKDGDEETAMSPYNQNTILTEWERLDDTMAGKHAQNLAAYRARKGGHL